MRFLPLLLAPLLLGAAPTDSPSAAAAHDRDPWIFRCVLDNNARMVVISLGNDIWAAYDANRCRLAKVWQGDVEFTGPVYDTRHGPQPKSKGKMLLNRPARVAPLAAGATTRPADEELDGYRGYRINGDLATLNFEFDGVQIQETPALAVVNEAKTTVMLGRKIEVAGSGANSGPITLEVPTSAKVITIRLAAGSIKLQGSDKTIGAPANIPFNADENLKITLDKPGTIVLETTLSTE